MLQCIMVITQDYVSRANLFNYRQNKSVATHNKRLQTTHAMLYKHLLYKIYVIKYIHETWLVWLLYKPED